MFGIWSKIDVASTAVSRHSNRLVLPVLDSEQRLRIFQQLRTTLMSLTTRWPTTWRRQHWPWRLIANDVIVIRPPDIVLGGLRFYHDSASVFFFSSVTLRARAGWTELNQHRPHDRKWVRFENVCQKSGVYPHSTNRRPRNHLFDEFAT